MRSLSYGSKTIFYTTIFIIFLAPVIALAEGVGVTARVDALAMSYGGSQSITPKLYNRLGFSNYTYHFSRVYEDTDYELDISPVSALLNWYPMKNQFYFSAGIFSNQNELNSISRSAETNAKYDIAYTSSNVGAYDDKVDFSAAAPYLGLGWDKYIGSSSMLTVNFDLGVMFQSSADVTPNSVDTVVTNPTLQAELIKEKSQLDDELSQYKHNPVISVGLTYLF